MDNVLSKKKYEKESNVIFLINCGIVGCGKSTVYSILCNTINTKFADQIKTQSVSSDGIRGDMIKELLKKNPKMTFQQAFDASGKGFKNNWDKEFNKVLESIDKTKINIIYIDKNFPPNTLTTFSNEAKKFGNWINMNGLAAVFYPKIKTPISLSKYLSFPFSYDYLIQCYFRIQNRKDHETLDLEKSPTFYLIYFMFLKFYKGFEFSQLKSIFDFQHEISYTTEKGAEVGKFPELLEAVFKNSFSGKDVQPKYDDNVKAFIEYINSSFKLEDFGGTKSELETEMTECNLY